MGISGIRSLIKEAEDIAKNLSAGASRHIMIDNDRKKITFLIRKEGRDSLFSYEPSPTLFDFHKDNTENRLLMGAYGSGKSTASLAEIYFRACEMPRCFDGVRRSRWLLVRNTYDKLMSTTYKTWRDWFGWFGVVKKRQLPSFEIFHTFNDGNGLVEVELNLKSLDRIESVDKLQSLEITGAYVNELWVIPSGLYDHLTSRVGRYPRQIDIDEKDYWKGIISDTNPPSDDHWIPKMFNVGNIGYKIFRQPSGLLMDDKKRILRDENGDCIANPNAENLKHLSEGYYVRAARGKNEEYIKVYCCGEYGTVRDGDLVFNNYNDDVHAVDNIDFDPSHPVFIGWDYGLTPACILEQFIDGQRRSIKEFTSSYCSIREFAENKVIPFLTQELKGFSFKSFGDTAGATRAQTDGQTPNGILSDLGIPTIAVSGEENRLNPRFEAVDYFLMRMAGAGKPAYIVSKKGCPVLRKGYLREYYREKLNKIGSEEVKDMPVKSHPYSDIQDAAQYCALQYVSTIKSEHADIESDNLVRNLAIHHRKY